MTLRREFIKAVGFIVSGGIVGGAVGFDTGRNRGYDEGFERGEEHGIDLAGGIEPSRGNTKVRSESQSVTVKSGDHHAIHFTFNKETFLDYFVAAEGSLDIFFLKKQHYQTYQDGGDDPEYLVRYSDLDTSRATRSKVLHETGEFVLVLDNTDYGRTEASRTDIDIQYSVNAWQRTNSGD